MDRFIIALSDFVIEKVAHESSLIFQAKFIEKIECLHCKSKKLQKVSIEKCSLSSVEHTTLGTFKITD